MLPAATLLFFLLGAGLQTSFTPTGVEQGYLASNSSESSSGEALVQASGEFRATIANILWINIIDHYHHQYMAQGHAWSTDVELLPMLNMVIGLDSHFIQAYEVSSSILLHVHRMPEAVAMLNKGAENNPGDWQIQYDTAMMYAWYMKDPKTALPYAIKARTLVNDDFDKRMVGRLVNTLSGEANLKPQA
jgi:hypothetical protein